LLIRFIAGKISDNYGRISVIKVALVLLCVSFYLIGHAVSVTGLLIGSIVYGIAGGVLSPATNAWTIDLSHSEHRGKAMATMYIALEAGIGLGALLAGWMYKDIISMVPVIFYIAAGASFLALIYVFFKERKVSYSTLRQVK